MITHAANTKTSIYVKPQHAFNSHPAYTLSYTLEAALNYFVQAMLTAEPEEVAEISLEFHQWRDSALEQTKALQADKVIKDYQEGEDFLPMSFLGATIKSIAQIEQLLTEFAAPDNKLPTPLRIKYLQD